MNKYNLVAENPESTVVAEYTPSAKCADSYQSEAELEKALIVQLQDQAYEYLSIKSEEELIANLRLKLERLNNFRFSDKEWDEFFKTKIANQNSGIVEKTTIIQEDHIQLLTCDDGSVKNIYLLDKENIHNNSLQVINQYEPEGAQRANRYDVTILVNGLPLVHIELKRRGVDIKEAFNQINRYNRESFWAGSGLFEYVQLFVISNGTYTKYYSNTTRFTHIKEHGQNAAKKGKQTSNSFEFTSWWADALNRPITDLVDFTNTFFAKHTLLSILTRYCVFTSDNLLLVMRPYQIVATERILNKIAVSENYETYGTIKAGGYVWHTTGSGKTLTSFKTARLASRLPFIDKVLFVVDRKDLDYQTMKEYDKFEKGAANSNTSTRILQKQLEDPACKIIITTIQKLSILLNKSRLNDVLNRRVVIIFDECHRSQFGDMHVAITKHFKKYHIFGFTGTPIFAVNSSSSGRLDLKTTEQAFGDKLHTYTIVDAIADKNVLPFRIDYVSTMREAENIEDEKVRDIDRERALASPDRISNIVKYIREHFDQKTKRNESYRLKERRLRGFNSIFAVSSIDVAKKYYTEFQRQMKDLPGDKRLKVALIYSFCVNEDDPDNGFLDDENLEDTTHLDVSSRDFLEGAIKDYNGMFRTNYDTSSEKFQNYYKDVSQRIKDREIDLVIVVNMFLTGFDATTLNTLWVDKNLRMHGLLQAYSRTNRILNSVKTFGNIVCFRNLESATNKSIALFGDKKARGVVLLRPYDDYYYGYKDDNGKEVRGYKGLIEELQQNYPMGVELISETSKKDFIKLYGSILRIKNILASFDKFEGNEILSPRDVQDYHSMYINLYNEFRDSGKADSENVNDDIVFEMELIKQVEINIDYILLLIRKYHDGHMEDKEIIVSIRKAIDSSVELRNKKDLIERFIDSLIPSSDVDNEFSEFIKKAKEDELNHIIEDENLNDEETHKFIDNAFRDGYIQTSGIALTKILPPVSRFSPSGIRTKKRESVIEKLKAFFNRFRGISDS